MSLSVTCLHHTQICIPLLALLFLLTASLICVLLSLFFFFNDTATTEIYTLSLHDALPIWAHDPRHLGLRRARRQQPSGARDVGRRRPAARPPCRRAGVPDRAPALRRERGLRRPLQGAGVVVSAVPGFMALLGLTIEHADAEEAVVRMDVPDALMSPFGAVHGGFIAALLDTGFGIALHRRLDAADRIATHSLNVTYVAFSREQLLICRTRVVSLREAVAVVEGEVTTGDGTLVAKALGTFGVRRA